MTTTPAGTSPTQHPGRRPGRLLGLLLSAAAGLGLVAGIAATDEATSPTVAAPQASPTPAMAFHLEPNPVLIRAISRQLGLVDDPDAIVDAERAGLEDEEALVLERHGAPDEVHWTVRDDAPAEVLASNWGLGGLLFDLNPELRRGDQVPAGTVLKVYAADPEKPTRSIGACNRGRLQSGMPIPEGDAWRLRPVRRRAFGSTVTVGTLVAAFNAYGERFPEAPKVRVGELAGRKGGKARPHRSHRSGRDVDLGYIVLGEDDGEIRWRRMHKGNFDAEKNWFLIHEMIKTGNVETIFVSRKLQPLLYEIAKQELSEEELAGIFQHPRGLGGTDPVIRHWKGHHDHMHVRFRCEADNRRCRGERVEGI
ncbi:MAG: penicillin-insensitive murein endopeptidase [Nannocystaceae bacterium]